MAKYILTIDQGTSSTRAIIYDIEGKKCGVAQQQFSQIYPKSGHVEHNPLEIWDSVVAVTKGAMDNAKINSDQVAAIGITNQRETTVVWDRQTGEPIYNAIVWQDRRTAKQIDALKERSLSEEVTKRSGLVLDAYFSASKVQWILDKVPDAREKAEQGKLCFGTIDSWLIWQLTGGRLHATDITNASRTLLLNISDLTWDAWLLDLFNIPHSMLPELKDSSEVIGVTAKELFGSEIPIAGIAGDQQAATFGHASFQKGVAKNTYGTGSFIVLPTGNTPQPSSQRLLTTVCWKLKDELNYALEGSIFTTGSLIIWLREGLGIIDEDAQISELAASVPDNGGVYFVPALAGLGAPHWDQYARGTIIGISRATTKAHIAHAALQGIACQAYDVIKALEKDSKITLTSLRVDGGVTKSDFLMQLQADILGIPVIRPSDLETTARGAAYLAGLAVGFWKNKAELESLVKTDQEFVPHMLDSERSSILEKWNSAVERAKGWVDNSEE